MTYTELMPPSTAPRVPAGPRLRQRKLPAATLAVAAATTVWAIARGAAGTVHTPAFSPSARPTELPVTLVIVAAIVSVTGAWALATTSRRTRHARRLWFTATGLLAMLSLSAPLSGHGIPTWNRLALIGMHLALAGVIIPAFAPSRQDRAPDRA